MTIRRAHYAAAIVAIPLALMIVVAMFALFGPPKNFAAAVFLAIFNLMVAGACGIAAYVSILEAITRPSPRGQHGDG